VRNNYAATLNEHNLFLLTQSWDILIIITEDKMCWHWNTFISRIEASHSSGSVIVW